MNGEEVALTAMDLQLKEIFVAPFTTSTTCFSCTPCATINRSLPFRFVTENHILGLTVSDGSCKAVTYGSVPRDKASVICVGLAQYATPEPLQALAFIDPTCIDQPEDAPPPLHHPPSHGAPETAIRDDASIISNTHSILDGSTTASSRPNSRRQSFNSTSVATATSVSIQSALSRTNSDSSALRMLDSSTRINSNEDGPIPTTPISLQPPKARLILQGPSKLLQDSIAVLDFRPLSPCIARWGTSFGVFVGSADDSQLRFYEPKEGRLVARSDLPEEHFSIDTPIMSIDFHTDGKTHTLALAGQDGTIQLITWKGEERTFHDISSHTVIVDGPLVSLQIQERSRGELYVVVGSLCGYVCRLKRPSSSSSSSSSASLLEWQGPTMVVQGLWSDHLQDEDSVLAVHPFGDCVAIGTLGGRCMIYQASQYGEKYYKFWECTLPYSIHGLEVRSTTVDSFDLIIVTRRSLHVFRSKTSVLIHPDKPKYSVEVAKNRLQSLLQARKPKPPDSLESPTTKEEEEEGENHQMIPDHTEDGELVDENSSQVSREALTSTLTLPKMENSLNETDEENKDMDRAQEILQSTEEKMSIVVPEQTVLGNEDVSGSSNNVQDLEDDSQWIMIDVVEEPTNTEAKMGDSGS